MVDFNAEADYVFFSCSSFPRISCGKSNGGKVDPSFRARICGACLKKDFIDPHSDSELMNELNRFTKFCTKYETQAKGGQESREFPTNTR